MSRRDSDLLQHADALREVFGPGGHLASRIREYEYRPGQLRMARAVAAAIENEETLLAEAGTGTGKTLAYLAPAVLSGQKTVVSTGTKTLQEQLYTKDLPLLASALPLRFLAALMKGRGNYLCRIRLRDRLSQPLTGHERDRLLAIQRWSADSVRGDRAELDWLPDHERLWDDVAAEADTCLGTNCPDSETCFLTRMRAEALAADVVVVNHHLLLADAVLRDTAAFPVIPPYEVLVLDEAHLLEEVATDFFGAEISSLRVERLIGDTQRELVQSRSTLSAAGHLGLLAEVSARFFRRLPVAEGSQRLRGEDLEQVRSAGCDLAESLRLLHDLLQALPEKREEQQACGRRAEALAVILETLLRPRAPEIAPDVQWVERRGRAVVLRSSPLDVSKDFRRTVLVPGRAVVLTSATLSAAGRFEFLRRRLGIETAQELTAPSPFDYAQQAILYIPAHLPDPRHPGFVAAAAQEIAALLRLSHGRALVLFTSLEAMETTYRLLERQLPFPLMMQGQAPRGQLLERFREDVASVLLATRSFWQGVDFAGETLSCLIVHKLPFGFPGDPVIEARLEHLQQRGDDPFWEYQVPSAILALRQGLGRLIRTAGDRGALCILDGRLLTRGYGSAFLGSLPPCPRTQERHDVERFFAAESGN